MSGPTWFHNALERVRNFGTGRAGSAVTATSVLDHYVSTMPSAQNAVDAVPGWNHAFPPESDIRAGHVHLYYDDRILWCLEQAGAVEGKTILELGPLEGMHTYMLAKAGAGHVDAVEANALAYMRCLICREILKFDRASFWLGDFTQWLEQPDRRYDLVVASGVLYHSSDPIRLIELISQAADSFYIWTHYYDDLLQGDLRGVPFSGRVEERTFRGVTVRLHERSYYKAWRDPKFCGGMQDRHFWMTQADILRLVDCLGFDSVTAHDAPEHVNGPSFSVFARRKPGSPRPDEHPQDAPPGEGSEPIASDRGDL